MNPQMVSENFVSDEMVEEEEDETPMDRSTIPLDSSAHQKTGPDSPTEQQPEKDS